MDQEELIELYKAADKQHDLAIASGNTEQAALIANDIRGILTAMSEGQPTSSGSFSTEPTGVVDQTMSGVNEGISDGLLGAPVDLATMALNSPQTLSNWIGRGVNAVTGEDTMRTDYEPWIEDPVGGSEWFRNRGEDLGVISPAHPDYEFARKSGQFAGNAIGAMTGLGAMSRAKTGVQMVDDVTASTAKEMAERPGRTVLAETMAAPAAVAAGQYGGDVGEKYGPRVGLDPETGRQIGETAGELIGGLGGATAAYGAGSVGRAGYSTTQSGAIYDAAKRMGIDASAGLVSPKLAGPVENTIAGVKVLGGGVSKRQQAQVDRVGEVAGEMTDDMRRGQPAAADGSVVGERVRSEGYDGLKAIDARLDDLQEEVFRSIGGKDAMIPASRVSEGLDDMRDRMDDIGKDAIDERIDSLVASGQPIDTALHSQLEKRMAYEKKRGMDTSQTRLQMARNTEINASAFEKWRKRLGTTFEGKPGVDADVEGAAYRDLRDTQRSAAAGTNNPDDLATFEASVEEKRRLVDKEEPLATGGDKPFLQDLTTQGGKARGTGSVYTFLTSPSAPERLEAYRRNVSPEQFERTMGDIVQELGANRTRKGSAQDADWDPGRFLTNWDRLPQRTKDLIFDHTAIEGRINDIKKVSKAMEQRAATGTTSSTFDRQSNMVVLAGLFSNFGLTLAAMASANAAGKYIMSDSVARAIAARNPAYGDEIMKLTARRGTAAANTDSSGEE